MCIRDSSYNFDGILEDENADAGFNLSMTNNIQFDATASRDMERFGGIDFFKTRYRFFGVVSTIRQVSFGLGGSGGDQIFFDEENPYLGSETGWNAFINLRLIPQLESRINLNTNQFKDLHNPNDSVFDVKILRAQTTYQFTDRLLLRHIMEHNTQAVTVGNNILFTYRLNAGTVAFLGYDDRYQRGTRIDNILFQTTQLQRTNRAFFGKISYLFRY